MGHKTSHQKGVSESVARLLLIGSLLSICSSIGFLSLIPKSYAHFSHLAHYNGGGIGLGKYYINEQLDPEYTPPKQPIKISFSIQDNMNGNDVHNILTMMEIYSVSSDERIAVYPWTRQSIGDFDLYYIFPRVGLYEIVLSIADSTNSNHVNLYGVDPPRSILSSNLNCGCDRAVFNLSVSESFGNIFNFAVFGGIISAIVVFGIVLLFTYRNRIKHSGDNLYPKLNKNEVIKYSVLILAVSSGIVHLAVYSEHGGLRIEYSIFLLAAGASQIAYSMLYVLLTIAGESAEESKSREFAKSYYHKSVAVNLFGLVGSAILLGLYTYSVIFPPPLSPNNVPEDVDLGGILDKTLEAALVIGVVYLMRSEKRNLQNQLLEVK
jgi:heme/copper-type cytochrome/quinol oxidase subunit 3